MSSNPYSEVGESCQKTAKNDPKVGRIIQIRWFCLAKGKLGDVSTRFSRSMANATFETRQKLANLLINSVTLYPDKAVVQGNIPITNIDALSTSNFWRVNSLW